MFPLSSHLLVASATGEHKLNQSQTKEENWSWNPHQFCSRWGSAQQELSYNKNLTKFLVESAKRTERKKKKVWKYLFSSFFKIEDRKYADAKRSWYRKKKQPLKWLQKSAPNMHGTKNPQKNVNPNNLSLQKGTNTLNYILVAHKVIMKSAFLPTIL